MDIRNAKNHVFNIKFAKLTGLYQMLDPATVKFRGRNIYHIAAACVLAYMCLISMFFIPSGLYNWTVNIPISMDYFWKSVTVLYVIYKTCFIIRYSNDIWNCLSITRYDFTSIADRNGHVILDRWRQRLVWSTAVYAIMCTTATTIYLVITLAFSEVKSPVKGHDGSIGYYRQNAMNFYLIVSDETYNAHYYMFYFVEALSCAFILLFFFIFDFLLVTLCFSVCCQMQIICSAFKSVGHKSLRDHQSEIDYTYENIKIPPNENELIYDELKTIIMDHQAVMQKYEDFLTLFRRLILLHILVSSLLVIAIWFTFIMNESIVFALYSSNWTEMDMKCKKLILLTMKLNNANHKNLKFTTTKIVNLEMFFKTMGHCYTIISVLVNYLLKKDE